MFVYFSKKLSRVQGLHRKGFMKNAISSCADGHKDGLFNGNKNIREKTSKKIEICKKKILKK